ncbi:MAG: hypothetical protein M1828_001582 [Chrysothrix sp. TS-e1954]|nr:MAG: hypothetical protein M1828_001582 [Chrysothrix sp. TS-e1954]
MDISILLPDPDAPAIDDSPSEDPPNRVSEPRWPYPNTKRLDNTSTSNDAADHPNAEQSGEENAYIWTDDAQPAYDAPMTPDTLPPGMSFANIDLTYKPEEYEPILQAVRDTAWQEHQQGIAPTGDHDWDGVMYKAYGYCDRPDTAERLYQASPNRATMSEGLKWRLTTKQRASEEEATKKPKIRLTPDGPEVRLEDKRQWFFVGMSTERPINERLLEETIRFLSIYYRMEQVLLKKSKLKTEFAAIERDAEDPIETKNRCLQWKLDEIHSQDFLWDTVKKCLKDALVERVAFDGALVLKIANKMTRLCKTGLREDVDDVDEALSEIEREEPYYPAPICFHRDPHGLKKALLAAQYKVYASDGRNWEYLPEVEIAQLVLGAVIRTNGRDAAGGMPSFFRNEWRQGQDVQPLNMTDAVKRAMIRTDELVYREHETMDLIERKIKLRGEREATG